MEAKEKEKMKKARQRGKEDDAAVAGATAATCVDGDQPAGSPGAPPVRPRAGSLERKEVASAPAGTVVRMPRRSRSRRRRR